MADVQPDPTDTGTLRPKRKPLQKTGDNFIPMDVPDFLSKVMLPPGIAPLDALGIFELFLPDPILDIIVENTNNPEGRAHGPWKPNARAIDWIPMTRRELKTYIAIIIYMGLHIEQKLETYWSTDSDSLYHIIPRYMSLRRFQLLHRRFRMRCPTNSEEVPDLWSKVSGFP
jgi:hypothetical protein